MVLLQSVIGVISGDEGSVPHFLEWEDGPPLYKYTSSLVTPTFQTKVTPLSAGSNL